MKIIDTHAHIYKQYYDDIKEVIDKSLENNVEYIINAGCDNNTNSEVLNVADKFECVYATLGIHPEYANDYQTKDLDFIIDNINNKKVVAIGEIGLDYHYENYNKENEIKLFELQLQIAKDYNFPVIVHSRDASIDTLNILKKYPTVKGIIHAFSGSYEIAKEYIKLGYYLGIGGVVTFKNAHIKEVISKIGLDNIVLETDSPYLSPDPLRGKRNFPGNINYVVDFLASHLNLPKEEIINITSKNAKKILDKLE